MKKNTMEEHTKNVNNSILFIFILRHYDYRKFCAGIHRQSGERM